MSGTHAAAARSMAVNGRAVGHSELVLVAVVVGAVYLATARYGPWQFNDVRGAAIGAWALANTGTVTLPASWGPDIDWWLVPTASGDVASNRFPGLFVVGLPFYLLARLTSLGAPFPTAPIEVPIWPSAVAGATVSTGAAVLLHRLHRALATPAVAIAATVAVAFGTALWTFGASGLWPHGPAVLLIAAMMWALHRDRLLMASLMAAGLPLLRPHLALVSVIVAVVVVRQSGVRSAVRWLVPLGASVVLLAVYSQVVFGTWVPAAGYDAVAHIGLPRKGLVWFGDEVVRGLIGGQRGVVVHSTFLLIVVPFAATAWRQAAAWERACLVAAGCYYLVQAALAGTQGGGEFFGYRVQLEAVVLSAPILVRAADRGATTGPLVVILMAATVAAAIGFHVIAG